MIAIYPYVDGEEIFYFSTFGKQRKEENKTSYRSLKIFDLETPQELQEV